MLVNGRTDLMDGQLSDSTRLNLTTVPRWRSQTVAFRAVFLLAIVFGLFGCGDGSKTETTSGSSGSPASGQGEEVENSTNASARSAKPALPPPDPPPFQNWEQPDLLLVLTGEQYGFLEPCGCSETQSGGFSRRADFFRQVKEKNWEVLPLDLGDTLTLKRSRTQDQVKFESILKGLNRMQYGALGIGRSEIRVGADRLLAFHQPDAPEGIPFVSANVVLFDTPELGTPLPYRIMERNGVKVGVTSVIGKTYREELLPVGGGKVDYKIEDPEQALPAVLEKMKSEKPDLLVLLSQATEKESRELATLFPDFNIVVTAGGVEDGEIQPQKIGNSWLVVAGAKGKHLAAVGYYRQKPADMKYELVELDNRRFGETPSMKELMQAYQDQLLAQNVALDVSTISHSRDSKFVGAKQCGECHTKAYAKWKHGELEPIAHARAFLSLKEGRIGQKEGWISRIHDPECLACHVTGWNPQEVLRYESGFVSEEQTPHLLHQQCENCHGPGGKHSELEREWKKTLKMTDEILASRKEMHLDKAVARDRVCFQCHDPDNSPKFDFDKYWKKVEHPGRD